MAVESGHRPGLTERIGLGEPLVPDRLDSPHELDLVIGCACVDPRRRPEDRLVGEPGVRDGKIGDRDAVGVEPRCEPALQRLRRFDRISREHGF